MMEAGQGSLEKFVLSSFPGNGAGLKMFVSAFVNGLKLLHMESQAQVALETTKNLDQ